MPAKEMGDDRGTPGHQENTPPDAGFPHPEFKREEVKHNARGNDLSGETDDESKHGSFQSL